MPFWNKIQLLSWLTYVKKCIVSEETHMRTKYISQNEHALVASIRIFTAFYVKVKSRQARRNLLRTVQLIWLQFDRRGRCRKKKNQSVPLSDNTIQRRIRDCATNMLDEWFRSLRLSESFAFQLDERTNVSKLAVLLVFVRYLYKAELEVHLLLCNLTEGRTTGEEAWRF